MMGERATDVERAKVTAQRFLDTPEGTSTVDTHLVGETFTELLAEIARLEARIEEVERERDLAREFAGDKQTSLVRQWREAAGEAEARIETLTQNIIELLR